MNTQTTNKFKKDLKRAKKMGKDIEKLQEVMEIIESKEDEQDLINDNDFRVKYKNHKLSGNFADRWDCHILPDNDFILLYKIEGDTVIFERTGTHAQLFR